MEERSSKVRHCLCRPMKRGRKFSVPDMGYATAIIPRGGDLGRTGGMAPQKNLRWGDGPCIRPPNILRSSVVGCAKVRTEKKSFIKEFFSEVVVFLVRKKSHQKFLP